MVAQLQAEAGNEGGTPVLSLPAVRLDAPESWTAAAPQGPGMLVRVRLIAGTPLKGVRAFLVVQSAQKLGDVGAVSPSLDALQVDDFDHDFALRLVTELSEDDVVAALRRAGDVDEVRAARSRSPSRRPSRRRPNRRSRRARRRRRERRRQWRRAGAPAAQRTHRPAAARQPDEPHRRARDHARPARAAHRRHGRSRAGRDGRADVAARRRSAGRDHDQPHGARVAGVRPLSAARPRRRAIVGKPVEFTIEGKEVELDRSMLDEVGDPIVHLLRNAIDHGIESPGRATRAGKAARRGA